MATVALEQEKIGVKEKISYGLAATGNNFLFDLGQLFLLKFYTDYLGLPAVVAGSVFLLTKIFDAFADLSVGTWVDGRQKIGPAGRFRPFMLYGIVPIMVMSVVCFLIPDVTVTWKTVYAYVTYMGFGFFYSLVNIPYGAMLPSITQDPVLRSEMAAYRTACGHIGLMISMAGFIPIVKMFSNPAQGYLVAATVFSIAGGICIYLSYAGIKERVAVKRKPKTFADIRSSYKSLFKNNPLMLICATNVLVFSAWNVKLAVQVYFCQYYLKDLTIMSYMGFLSAAALFAGVASVPPLVKRLGKKKTWLIGAGIWVVGDVLNYCLTSTPVVYMAFTCLAFYGSAYLSTLAWALESDTVEYGEWKTGQRAEGIVYSSFTFFRKLSQGLAGFIPGTFLGFVGYVPNAVQKAETLQGLKILVFVYPGVMIALALALMYFGYHLTEDRYKVIVAELNERKRQVAANSSGTAI